MVNGYDCMMRYPPLLLRRSDGQRWSQKRLKDLETRPLDALDHFDWHQDNTSCGQFHGRTIVFWSRNYWADFKIKGMNCLSDSFKVPRASTPTLMAKSGGERSDESHVGRAVVVRSFTAAVARWASACRATTAGATWIHCGGIRGCCCGFDW